MLDQNQTTSFSQFASFTSPLPSQSGTPQPSLQQQPKPPPANQASADPFAALASASTPTSFQQATAASANDDDEWNFSSALPPAASNKPKEHKGTINQSLLRTDYLAGRATGASNSIHITFAFSNNSAQPVTELHFQLAVTKVRCFSLASNRPRHLRKGHVISPLHRPNLPCPPPLPIPSLGVKSRFHQDSSSSPFVNRS